jgi:hypothetical protein
MGATQLTSLNLDGCYGVLMSSNGLALNEWEDLDDTEDISDTDMSEDNNQPAL